MAYNELRCSWKDSDAEILKKCLVQVHAVWHHLVTHVRWAVKAWVSFRATPPWRIFSCEARSSVRQCMVLGRGSGSTRVPAVLSGWRRLLLGLGWGRAEGGHSGWPSLIGVRCPVCSLHDRQEAGHRKDLSWGGSSECVAPRCLPRRGRHVHQISSSGIGMRKMEGNTQKVNWSEIVKTYNKFHIH